MYDDPWSQEEPGAYDIVHDVEPAYSAEVESTPAAPAPTSPGAVDPASVLLGEASDRIVMPEDLAGNVIQYSGKQQRRARDVLTRLYAVRRSARFYPMDHPAVMDQVDALLEASTEFHEEGVDVHLAFFEGEILLGEKILTEESVLFDQLIRDMTAIGAGSLVIKRGVTRDELARAVALFAHDAGEVEAAGGLERMVLEANIPHVEVGAVRVVEKAEEISGNLEEEAKGSYGGAITLMREIDRLLRANRAVSSNRVKGVVRSLVDNVLGNRYAMLQLTGLKNYDEYTFYHSANVAILSLALGSLITTDYRFLSSLGVGALLHDIGKLSVDLKILNKPGALSAEEWANVRQHPIHGAEMTALLPGVDKSSIVTILEHHMRFDSTGYPTRVPPRRQHLASRIVAVADSYDAMTSRRSYSAARVQDEAMLMLARSAGSSLDPTLVQLFISLMGVYPPRSVVRLSSGQVGIVLHPSTTDPLRPVIRVIAAASGEIGEPFDLDLTAAPELSVEGCIDPRLVNIEVEDYV
jgi:HD-GYP domain-containing protein (c-di-GMP phosphodiesterase class II)